MSPLRQLGGDLATALEEISVPSYVLDRTGVVRWLNPAAQEIVGDVRGRQFTSVVGAEDTRRAKEHFARKITGGERTSDAEVILRGANGDPVNANISSVALRDGHRVVGVFGQLSNVDKHEPRPHIPPLTPRQSEVLRMLQRGRSTHQISTELQLSPETVRNHVRALLRTLGVHTRLEAVALAHRGLEGEAA